MIVPYTKIGLFVRLDASSLIHRCRLITFMPGVGNLFLVAGQMTNAQFLAGRNFH